MTLPTQIESAMQDAIQYLSTSLSVSTGTSSTHQHALVTGWNNAPESYQAIARYLVGNRACAMDAAMNIRASLLDTDEDRIEVCQSVYQIIGESASDLDESQITNDRNPWIAEGVWHLCMVLTSEMASIHPLGSIVAINPLHINAKDHGIDVAAIYLEAGLCGLAIIETKAYKNRPNNAINDAVEYFREVDNGIHNTRIRQVVQTLRRELQDDLQPLVPVSFWKTEREYIPNPHYESSNVINWSNPRPSFRGLIPDSDHMFIMPHPIDDFDLFFDTVSEEMRRFVGGL